MTLPSAGEGARVCQGPHVRLRMNFLVFYVFKIFMKIFVQNEIFCCSIQKFVTGNRREISCRGLDVDELSR